ncbi:hypothetical protein GBF38_009710, partial [Nibea albiflora]
MSPFMSAPYPADFKCNHESSCLLRSASDDSAVVSKLSRGTGICRCGVSQIAVERSLGGEIDEIGTRQSLCFSSTCRHYETV